MKFSIIIPVYNVARAPLRALRVACGDMPCETSFFGAFYLRECLDSVLAQTFADWEAICVDDRLKARRAVKPSQGFWGL